MTQSTWDDFAPAEEEQPEAGYDGRPLDPEQGCPWCLAPREAHSLNENGLVRCDLCMAVQPIDQLWYQAGDKIIEPRRASEIFQRRWQRLFE